MSDKEKVSNEDLEKALKILGIGMSEVQGEKIEKSQSGSEDDGEDDGKEKSDLEIKKAELNDIQKSLDAKQKEIDELESEDDKESESLKKSEDGDLIDPNKDNEILKKSFSELNQKLDSVVTIYKSQAEDNEDLRKSFDEVKNEVSEIYKVVDAIGKNTPGMKSHTNMSFLKSEVDNNLVDEDGKKTLSVSRNKREIEAVLEKAYDNTKDESVKDMIGVSLQSFNSGGAPIEKAVQDELYNNYDVVLVK